MVKENFKGDLLVRAADMARMVDDAVDAATNYREHLVSSIEDLPLCIARKRHALPLQ